MIQGTPIDLICPICNSTYQKSKGHYNRAVKLGAKLYCSKQCFSVGRKQEFEKHLKTPEQLKQEKSAYDKEYRNKNLEKRKKQAVEYNKTEAGRASQKRRRSKIKEYHNEYCRLPEQRYKERIRRYIRLGQLETKSCLKCSCDKPIIEFSAYAIFPDKRNYICKSCELDEKEQLGMTMRSLLSTIRANLVKTKSTLNIRDIVAHPYLVEANKYLLLLKRITK